MAWYRLFFGNPPPPVVETFSSTTFLFSTTSFVETGEISTAVGSNNSKKLRYKRERFYAH